MVEKIRLGEQWYILATSSSPDERRRVLKENDTFAMFDRFGDIQPIGVSEEGIYRGDTCFLSQQELLIEGVRPLFLNSTVRDDNGLLTVELMNPDLHPEGKNSVPKGTLHVFRAKLLWNDVCQEHIRVANFGLDPVEITLSIEFGASYADIFEVRGFRRNRRGDTLAPKSTDRELLLGYRGLDGTVRKTRINFDPPPQKLSSSRADYKLHLLPKEETHLYFSIGCEVGNEMTPAPVDYFSAFTKNNEAMAERLTNHCRISTSNDRFNQWLDRSTADLVMLTTVMKDGTYPYAGLPWYSTTFGRDGILTAYEYLWLDPGMARGVLTFLASTQAAEFDPARDAEPGKILHEARNGELAELNEIPFGRYYGSVDATPLFVGLAGAYYERTGDLEFIRGIWDNILRALHWIDNYGDRDGDGFVEYARYTEAGLAQQGWKDSQDSVFHRDGRFAEAPIALCEVQGYVYDARLQAARLAGLLGDDALKQDQERAAQALKKHFNDAFWCEEINMYALALDGKKQQCAVPSSNAGHALWSGIATPERAARVAAQLVSEKFFCGWGVRTIPTGEARYNPMAYHNGSVWPHDNAIIASGMARYGLTGNAMQVFAGLWDTIQYMDQYRMPELFCGFSKRPDEGPTLYPVACSPQAWAAASVFYLLQACLGLSFDSAKSEIRFRHPKLPPFLESATIDRLAVGDAVVDLQLQRYTNNVGINIMRRSGNVEVVSVA
ncbi:amylo-alpha-1,6-glucosidase [Noviherbaspirillum sp. Root189]|uniref:amylo-alpha-1,6-glucosidase n=1 Tax=Noviherbaspirillum sp. Root189 TaxID=1736487 RepID=UPI00070A81DB|nr:amylo-alpha-1,6-glucosidase [Noviherbaspirillum sp. Root189]KRB84850.1 amylo-alpha-1,6-glucosidase [Noviherbaspirillum sp. Root189]